MQLASFITIPILFVVIVAVMAVLFIAWQTAQPTLSHLATQSGVPLNGTGISGVAGINQTTYLNVGNNLYSFDFYVVLIFYIAMLSISLATLVLGGSPIAWLIAVLFAPFVYWTSAYISNIAYTIFSQAVLTNSLNYLPSSIAVMAQLQNITILFYVIYIIALSVRLIFYNAAQTATPSTPRQLQGFR